MEGWSNSLKSYQIIGPFFVLYVALALGITTYRIAIRPTREASRLGMRGLKRQRALLHSSWWTDIEPFIRWMGVRLSGVLNEEQRAGFDRRLTFSGDYLGLSADELLACHVICGVLGLGAGILVAVFFDKFGIMPVPILLGLGAAIPAMRVDAAREDRMKSINRGLPYAIDLIALSMSAGGDFPGSVAQVIQKSQSKNDALIDELAYILQQLELGRTRTQALRDFMARTPSEPVADFVQAVIQAEERGNPLAAVLAIQAEASRTRRTNAAEKNAADMNTKMAFPTFIYMGIVLVFIAYATTSLISDVMGKGGTTGYSGGV